MNSTGGASGLRLLQAIAGSELIDDLIHEALDDRGNFTGGERELARDSRADVSFRSRR